MKGFRFLPTFCTALVLFLQFFGVAQDRPKLVVGLVVDQMRYDYLFRFSNRYTQGGFLRMIREGYTNHAAHYNYVPTYTAPGHASIYTGTTPSVHGIIANEWYSRPDQSMVYCVDDSNYVSLGTSGKAGQKSPKRLLCNTLGDALKIFSQGQSKVFSVAIKDRSAILPGGHMADGAFWFEGGKNGNWISSSYYYEQLPRWVEGFNGQRVAQKMTQQDWNTLYPLTTYSRSGPDNNPFESAFNGETQPVFPHKLKSLAPMNDQTSILRYTPFGNTLTLEFAQTLIKEEHLGEDEMPDLLAISFSPPDYIGHRFGTHSVELEDTYLRLDEDINRFFQFLDKTVGAGNYLVFLTSDHGAMDTPAFIESMKSTVGYFDSDSLLLAIKDFTGRTFNNENIVENISNQQIYLNGDSVSACGLGDDEIESILDFIQEYQGIDKVVLSGEVELFAGDDIYSKLKKGYHNRLSGDILFTLLPNWIEYGMKGTTHGSGNEYDTHVPVLFMGWGVKPGNNYEKIAVEDIIPSVSTLIKTPMPGGTTGKPIINLFR